jgi:hypothetical protein
MKTHYSHFGDYFCYKFPLSAEHFNAAPKWRDSDAFPPLSPRVAIAHGTDFIRLLLAPELGEFTPKFSSCALERVAGPQGDWWHYMVTCYVPNPDSAADWSAFDVPVMLDGVIPTPKKYPYEERFDMYRSD